MQNIFPTRMALTSMKGKLKGAQQGHSLLKRKAEALTRRFREILKKINDVRFFLELAGGDEAKEMGNARWKGRRFMRRESGRDWDPSRLMRLPEARIAIGRFLWNILDWN